MWFLVNIAKCMGLCYQWGYLLDFGVSRLVDNTGLYFQRRPEKPDHVKKSVNA